CAPPRLRGTHGTAFRGYGPKVAAGVGAAQKSTGMSVRASIGVVDGSRVREDGRRGRLGRPGGRRACRRFVPGGRVAAGGPIMPHMVGIVTGASRGIGRAVALELARRGVTVALASRDREACLAVAEEVAAAGGAASAHGCDVADAREVDRLVAEVASLHGRVDVLVNNAGVIEPIGLIDECDPDAWR